MIFQNETIAAISTPAGSGGIAVVRVSGGNAIAVVDKIYRGKVKLADAESHKALLGKIELLSFFLCFRFSCFLSLHFLRGSNFKRY